VRTAVACLGELTTKGERKLNIGSLFETT